MRQSFARPGTRRPQSRWLAWVAEESAKPLPCSWLLMRELFIDASDDEA